jgi:hypothetical protein
MTLVLFVVKILSMVFGEKIELIYHCNYKFILAITNGSIFSKKKTKEPDEESNKEKT